MLRRSLALGAVALSLAVVPAGALAVPRDTPAPAPKGLVAKLKLQALHPTKFELKLALKCVRAYSTRPSGPILPKPPVCTKLRTAIFKHVTKVVLRPRVVPALKPTLSVRGNA